MSEIPSLSSVVETIEQLKSGDQAWFWLSPSRVRGAPQMLLSPFSSDPSMKGLMEWSHQMPSNDVPYMGFCSVREDGVFEFAGALIDEKALKITAKWVSKLTERYPNLKRLSKSRFLRVAGNGVIGAVYEDADIWSEKPLSAMALIAEQIESAEEGQSFWCWLASIGPNMRPALRLIPTGEDPDATYFGSLIGSLQRRCTMGGQFVRGTLHKTEVGWGLVTTDSVSGWVNLRDAVVHANADAFPVLYQLLEMQLIGLSIGSEEEGATTTEPNEASHDNGAHLAVQEHLGNLTEENGLLFCFGVPSDSTQTTLVLGQNKSDFRQLAWAAAPKVNGRISLRKGLVIFQAKQAYPGFVAALAEWVGRADNSTTLSVLNKARFMQRDAEGNIVDKQKDDGVWSAVFPE